MILAAGRGERMRPLTDSIPKPLLLLGGKSLIAWHLEALARVGFTEVVINLSWQGQALRAALGDGRQFGLRIQFSDEGATALETGGGIFRALPLLGTDPFVVVNGDVWSDFDHAQWVANARDLATTTHAHLVLVPNPPQHPQGDFALVRGAIQFDKPQRFTFSGMGLYRPAFFFGCQDGKFPLLPLLRRAAEANALRGQIYQGAWHDIGTPQRLQELDRALLAGQSVQLL